MSRGDGRSGRRAVGSSAARRATRGASLAAAFILLTADGAMGQAVRVGTSTVAGRVTTVALLVVRGSPWTLSLSGRRSLAEGRWDSVALDVARTLWSSSGSGLELRMTGRYDGLKAPAGGFMTLELVWRPGGGVSLVGGGWARFDDVTPGEAHPRFQTALVTLRARAAAGVVMIASARYDARAGPRVDLGVQGLR